MIAGLFNASHCIRTYHTELCNHIGTIVRQRLVVLDGDPPADPLAGRSRQLQSLLGLNQRDLDSLAVAFNGPWDDPARILHYRGDKDTTHAEVADLMTSLPDT